MVYVFLCVELGGYRIINFFIGIFVLYKYYFKEKLLLIINRSWRSNTKSSTESIHLCHGQFCCLLGMGP